MIHESVVKEGNERSRFWLSLHQDVTAKLGVKGKQLHSMAVMSRALESHIVEIINRGEIVTGEGVRCAGSRGRRFP